MQEIQILMDGTRSNLEIACELGISYSFVESFADALLANELAIVEDRLPALS